MSERRMEAAVMRDRLHALETALAESRNATLDDAVKALRS